MKTFTFVVTYPKGKRRSIHGKRGILMAANESEARRTLAIHEETRGMVVANLMEMTSGLVAFATF